LAVEFAVTAVWQVGQDNEVFREGIVVKCGFEYTAYFVQCWWCGTVFRHDDGGNAVPEMWVGKAYDGAVFHLWVGEEEFFEGLWDNHNSAAVDGFVEASVNNEASVGCPVSQVVRVIPASAVTLVVAFAVVPAALYSPVGVGVHTDVAVCEGISANAYTVGGGVNTDLCGGAGAAVEKDSAGYF
jgi:hypothetical protein